MGYRANNDVSISPSAPRLSQFPQTVSAQFTAKIFTPRPVLVNNIPKAAAPETRVAKTNAVLMVIVLCVIIFTERGSVQLEE